MEILYTQPSGYVKSFLIEASNDGTIIIRSLQQLLLYN